MTTIKELKSSYSNRNIIAADLGYIITLPFKAAIDIAAQISDNCLNDTYKIIEENFITKQYNNQTDYWVDIESLGNITAIKAKNLAYFLSSQIQENSLLYINLNDLELDRDNELFLHFLQHRLPNLTIVFNKKNNHRQYLIYPDQQIPSNIAHDTLTLKNNLLLVEYNDTATEEYYNTMLCSLLPMNNDSLPKLSNIKNNQVSIRADEIIQYTWSVARMGAINLAINILKNLHKENQEIPYLINLQYMRLVSGYFHDAANESYDDIKLNPFVIRPLYYAKAYCGVLSNNVAIAQHSFQQIDVTPETPLTDINSLYCMNIYALYQHRIKNTTTALELEEKIEHQLNIATEPHTQMRYINSLNLARLHRSFGDITKSQLYFDSAYESINGMMSETDHVYKNINYASLYEKSNDIKNTFACWLRATLHWLSMRYPEALGWRAVRAILKRNSDCFKALPLNEISDIFYNRLYELSSKLNIDIKNQEVNFNFVQLHYLNSSLKNACYYGKDHYIGLIATETHPDDWDYHQPHHLKQLAFACLAHLGCLPNANQYNTIVIDTDHDTNMPTLLTQAIKRCILLDINQLHWNNKEVNLSINKDNLFSGLTVKYSPSHICVTQENQSHYVIYKRYKKNLLIQPDASLLLDELNKNSPIETIKKKYPIELLTHLEKEKIISYNYDVQKPG